MKQTLLGALLLWILLSEEVLVGSAFTSLQSNSRKFTSAINERERVDIYRLVLSALRLTGDTM
jgi:hypothetical protein